MYCERTDDFEVCVEPHYLQAQSDPSEGQYVWAYHVTIANNGVREARLMLRHWEITDADGRTEFVDGEGVVGETPLLAPGGQFEYSSGCPLRTPGGMMRGHYTMAGEDGGTFRISIPAFSLDVPSMARVLN